MAKKTPWTTLYCIPTKSFAVVERETEWPHPKFSMFTTGEIERRGEVWIFAGTNRYVCAGFSDRGGPIYGDTGPEGTADTAYKTERGFDAACVRLTGDTAAASSPSLQFHKTRQRNAPMRAYSNSLLTRAIFLGEVAKHQAADRYTKGLYWDLFEKKGCAVGCAIETIRQKIDDKISHSDHETAAQYLGIPSQLMELQDIIFEGLPQKQSLDWPMRFAASIAQDADTSAVYSQFTNWLLRGIVAEIRTTNEPFAVALGRIVDGIETDQTTDDNLAALKSASVLALAVDPRAYDCFLCAVCASGKTIALAYRVLDYLETRTGTKAHLFSGMADKLCELLEAAPHNPKDDRS